MRKETGREKLEDDVPKRHGYEDYKWINPKGIVVAQWARMKCTFGCKNYGKCGTCPPNTPSVADCRDFFRGYKTGVVFHFTKRVDKPEDRFAWTRQVNRKLLDLEREVFLSGYYKAFLLFMDSCNLVNHVLEFREKCTNPKLARPTPSRWLSMFLKRFEDQLPDQISLRLFPGMNQYTFLLIG